MENLTQCFFDKFLENWYGYPSLSQLFIPQVNKAWVSITEKIQLPTVHLYGSQKGIKAIRVPRKSGISELWTQPKICLLHVTRIIHLKKKQYFTSGIFQNYFSFFWSLLTSLSNKYNNSIIGLLDQLKPKFIKIIQFS